MPPDKVWNHYHGFIAQPNLVGGNVLDLRDFKLDITHLTQADKSLNERMWSYHPVDQVPDLAPTPMAYSLNIPGPPYDLAKVAAHAKPDERRRSELRVEILMFQYLKIGSFMAIPFLFRLAERKKRHEVAPLNDAVKLVTMKKEAANNLYAQGQFRAAVLCYLECLMDLMPWVACPLYLTSKQCYDSGLAELEASLWNNIGIAASKSTLLDERISICLPPICYAYVAEMRYVPVKSMYKSQVRDIEFIKSLIRRGIEPPQELAVDRMLQMNEESVPEIKDKTSSEWMHRHCITEHVCYNDSMLAKIRAAAVTP